jgi:hypothetical protein
MSKKQLEKIDVKCDICQQWRIIVRGSYEQNIKRNGFYRCSKCSPQRNKEFWNDPVKKSSHSKSVKSSTAYYKSLPKRNKKLSGKNNGMFGKHHTPEAKQKMSKSRKGKVGTKATAWKGGKTSFTQRIKKLIQTRYGWFTNVLKRDDLKCCWCGCTHNLDAHHIEPIVKIIKRITEGVLFENEDLKIEFVIKHPDIEDINLVNGITLCRSCHKRAHKNWGSHVRP